MGLAEGILMTLLPLGVNAIGHGQSVINFPVALQFPKGAWINRVHLGPPALTASQTSSLVHLHGFFSPQPHERISKIRNTLTAPT